MDEFIILIGSIFENFILLKMFDIFLVRKRKYDFVIALLCMQCLSQFVDTSKYPYALLLWVLVLFLYSLLSFEKCKIIQKVFFSFTCMGLAVTITFATIGLFAISNISSNVVFSGYMNIIITITSKVFLLLEYLLLKKIKRSYDIKVVPMSRTNV